MPSGINMVPPKLQVTKSALPNRHRGGAGVQFVLLIVIIILFGWFVVIPEMQKLTVQKQTEAASITALEDIRKNKSSLTTLIQTLRDSSEEIEILDEALPIDNRITKVHFFLDSITKAAGMTLASVNVDAAQNTIVAGDHEDLEQPFAEERKLHTLGVTLNATGTMDQGIGMLKALEGDARIVDIEGVDISSDGGGTLSFRLKLKMYYYSPQAPVAAK
jgi:Tfp pilus assembly protein PilO